MISRDDVTAAYRLLLGREPESDAVITHYATQVESVRDLRQLFLNSLEFRNASGHLLASRAPRATLSGKPMVVELDAAPDRLAALFAKVGAQWQHLGQTEPHWSVLTHDSYVQAKFQGNREAFFASGEAEMVAFESALARAGLGFAQFGSCLELGCGVGRVTAPLARRFARVLGVDISAAHLAVAREHLQAAGLAQVGLQHLQSIDAAADLGRFDVLYSHIVLQHNPPPVMARLLADLLGQLNPGGVAFFQLPTYKSGYRFAIDDYLAVDNRTSMEMHYFPQAALLDLIAGQRCRVLELREDDAIGLQVNAVSNTLLVQKAP